mmetsp:Transcript_11239/g.30012  ORF Transcript_11239/g.30012 Transcript_11239/m.30012 type:complete len:206 (-) Transcript_11239:29-646(-)
MLALFFRILTLVRLSMSETYAVKERQITKLLKINHQLMELRDRVHQILTTPLPFPYVHLVRTLLLVYLLSVPFFIDFRDGLWANICMPTLMALALFGIEEIGTQLENPFGSDTNDLDVQYMISALEMELMRTLEFVGDGVAREHFVWLPVPKFMQEETSKPFVRYLALASEVAHLRLPDIGGPTHIGGPRMRRTRLGPTAPPPGR